MLMNYAVIRSGGKQYKVSSGDELTIDKLSEDGKKSVVFDEVLLLVSDEKVSVGKPLVSGAKVEATMIENIKGEKIYVKKFKAKSRYRKTTGFRAQMSVVKIEKIDSGSNASEKKTKEPTKTVKKTIKK